MDQFDQPNVAQWHLCVSELGIISDNGFFSVRYQAITWFNTA